MLFIMHATVIDWLVHTCPDYKLGCPDFSLGCPDFGVEHPGWKVQYPLSQMISY